MTSISRENKRKKQSTQRKWTYKSQDKLLSPEKIEKEVTRPSPIQETINKVDSEDQININMKTAEKNEFRELPLKIIAVSSPSQYMEILLKSRSTFPLTIKLEVEEAQLCWDTHRAIQL